MSIKRLFFMMLSLVTLAYVAPPPAHSATLSATKLPVTSHRLNPNNVLPATDAFAHGFVVQGQRAYFFPPDSTVTASHGLILVRSYRSLYVFNGSKAVIRQLSSRSYLQSFAPEVNAPMLQ